MHKKSLQTRYLEILEGHHTQDRWSRFSQMFITTLVLANIVAVVLESVPSVHDKQAQSIMANVEMEKRNNPTEAR